MVIPDCSCVVLPLKGSTWSGAIMVNQVAFHTKMNNKNKIGKNTKITESIPLLKLFGSLSLGALNCY